MQPPDQFLGIDGRDAPRLEGGAKLFTIAFAAAIRLGGRGTSGTLGTHINRAKSTTRRQLLQKK
jgi:hypothetical protein